MCNELNVRSDMFSVGGTLFYLLSGRVAFEGLGGPFRGLANPRLAGSPRGERVLTVDELATLFRVSTKTVYVREQKDAVDARFVLACHNMMMGHSEAAKEQFEKVLAKVPQDQLAAGLLTKLGGTPPAVTSPAPPVPAFAVPPSPPVAIPPNPAENQPKSSEPKAF